MIQNTKKKTIITTLTIFICLFFTISSVLAVANYYAKQKKENIKLFDKNNFPCFTVEKTDGNNDNKTLLPLPIPNFNQVKYSYLITVDHEATFKSNGMEITTPLYLKTKLTYNTKNTFNNPAEIFNTSLKINNNEYDDAKRPQMVLDADGNGKLKIKFGIEQREIIDAAKPTLDVILDYELVDSQGKSFGGGSQTIQQKITQTA
ncbi:hypothetical protein HGD80_03450 [Paulownia witches'-broom phytoplasma]|uniref:Uncharacterized protein n=1 Tax=Paulownia witches'-broom phytoplasma TaxID=39647 RepID=A0ABX8TN27_9MOLU|nr:hypothetical protein [Paulownia witches'-broom phytoplasma]QYC30824.1 hypothetical protein HGD80_03450 [Paulownia witches'-broom phytoplasma]GLH60556.1 hypothetical protein PAWBP_2940 [Paulownia witches'-broom phytoplasma]